LPPCRLICLSAPPSADTPCIFVFCSPLMTLPSSGVPAWSSEIPWSILGNGLSVRAGSNSPTSFFEPWHDVILVRSTYTPVLILPCPSAMICPPRCRQPVLSFSTGRTVRVMCKRPPLSSVVFLFFWGPPVLFYP